jgi:DNA-binding XRE family transcriptional regulator
MNSHTLTPEEAAGLGRMAWHTGMNEAQLCAIFRTLGHAERAEISRHGLKAFRHVAIDMEDEGPEAPPKQLAEMPALVMNASMIALWRERMGYSLTAAAKALGCTRTTLTGYEHGQDIPRYIGLACAALAVGMSAYGEEKEAA